MTLQDVIDGELARGKLVRDGVIVPDAVRSHGLLHHEFATCTYAGTTLAVVLMWIELTPEIYIHVIDWKLLCSARHEYVSHLRLEQWID